MRNLGKDCVRIFYKSSIVLVSLLISVDNVDIKLLDFVKEILKNAHSSEWRETIQGTYRCHGEKIKKNIVYIC